MKIFRIVVGILGLLALVLFTLAVVLPPMVNDQNALLELLFPVIAIPVFILNIWAWMYPEFIESSFSGKEEADVDD